MTTGSCNLHTLNFRCVSRQCSLTVSLVLTVGFAGNTQLHSVGVLVTPTPGTATPATATKVACKALLSLNTS